jgi:uncharacterized protein YqjF (DUF2071 family)
MPTQPDFNYDVIRLVSHRPWPMPDSPWIMTQSWHDLLFAHWPIDAERLRARVPSALPLDLHDGTAWLGVVPFRMTNVGPRGLPALPWVSAFPELNVRTYVSLDGRPGVYFFSLDAGNPLAARAGRTLFSLPYYSAAMSSEEKDGWIEYRSRRAKTGSLAEFSARYRCEGSIREPQPGTLDHFLTERYCLYTVDGRSRVYRADIHHPPWPLQPAALEISINTMADAAGIQLPSTAPVLHFAGRQDVVVWPLARIW